VVAVRDLYYALNQIHRDIGYSDEYAAREQVSAAIDAQNSRNGFLVDTVVATNRVNDLSVRRKAILDQIVEKYSLPTEGKSPWASNAGKTAIFAALADYGITPDNSKNWPHTKPGKKFPKGTPSLGGQVLIDLTVGTEAEELGVALAELKGQRSLAQLSLDSVHTDGKVHPEITALQRSGRKSTLRPGLTIFGARGEGVADKAYYIAEPGCKLRSYDYSQADARIVAAYSGDTGFAKRFAEGVDAHELTGRVVFGDKYDDNPNEHRQVSKMMGHAFSYGAGAKTLAKNSGQPLEVAQQFVDRMRAQYPKVTAWQKRVAQEGESGWVTNEWGRKMRVDDGRSYTQSSSLYGQSGTRELMVSALLTMARTDIRLTTWLKAQVHDELVFSIPEEELDYADKIIREAMSVSWGPKSGGQVIDFTVSGGEPSDTWAGASH